MKYFLLLITDNFPSPSNLEAELLGHSEGAGRRVWWYPQSNLFELFNCQSSNNDLPLIYKRKIGDIGILLVITVASKTQITSK